MVWALLVVLAITISSIAVYFLWPTTSTITENSFQIVVLGDVGRSPRMQYHALSIAQHGGHVELVGFYESDPIHQLLHHANVKFAPLPSPPGFLSTGNKALFLITAPLKVVFQVLTLWRLLACQTRTCQWMLVQNPPSIPTLALAAVACHIRGTKLVIDWHNFGYTILGMKLGMQHPLVRASKQYELRLANVADAHIAVTDAMRDVLRSEYRVDRPVLTLHDRPSPIFQPLTQVERSRFLTAHQLTAAAAADIISGRTRLLVSSTSWTADEDFSVLLEALRQYSLSATSDAPHLPELLVIITGKGPLRDFYLGEIQRLQSSQELEMVSVKTAWLSFEDYALLLGSADLGISLHMSSSGVDLPMKVVDMFGAGLPVLGYDNYKAWPELVMEGINGQGFSSANEMSQKLKVLCNPHDASLEVLRRGARMESERRWESEWNPVAGRLFGFVAL